MKNHSSNNSPDAMNASGLFLFPARVLRASGAINTCASELPRSRSAVLLSGSFCMKTYGSKIEVPGELKYIKFGGAINPSEIHKLKVSCMESNADALIGLGGGKVMDICKMVKKQLPELKLVLVPTSAATCAAMTPVSVIYDKAGKYMTTSDSACPDSVLFDYEIFDSLPQGFYASGMIDAMAKFLEIRRAKMPESMPDGYDMSAEIIARDSYFRLNEIIRTKWNNFDNEIKRQAAEINVVLSGFISCIGAQTVTAAAAHAMAHAVTMIPAAGEFLHGEHVGVGLLFQEMAAGDNETTEELRELLAIMGCPASFKDLGIKEEEMDGVIGFFLKIQKDEGLMPVINKKLAVETAFNLYK